MYRVQNVLEWQYQDCPQIFTDKFTDWHRISNSYQLFYWKQKIMWKPSLGWQFYVRYIDENPPSVGKFYGKKFERHYQTLPCFFQWNFIAETFRFYQLLRIWPIRIILGEQLQHGFPIHTRQDPFPLADDVFGEFAFWRLQFHDFFFTSVLKVTCGF